MILKSQVDQGQEFFKKYTRKNENMKNMAGLMLWEVLQLLTYYMVIRVPQSIIIKYIYVFGSRIPFLYTFMRNVILIKWVLAFTHYFICYVLINNNLMFTKVSNNTLEISFYRFSDNNSAFLILPPDETISVISRDWNHFNKTDSINIISSRRQEGLLMPLHKNSKLYIKSLFIL